MIRPIATPLVRQLAVPLDRPKNAFWTPAYLFAAGEQGVWYDPSDLSTLFQDTGATVPVTAAGQPVGLIRDKSGRNNHALQPTAASKPILRNSGLLWWLEFDGVDDFLVSGTIDFTATDKLSAFLGLRKLSDAAVQMVVELSVDGNTNNGAFYIAAPVTAGLSNYYSRIRGTTVSAATLTTFAAPDTAVLTVLGSIQANPAVQLARNSGAYAGSGSTAGTGNFGNYPLYIGRRAGLTLPFAGNFYGLVVRGVSTDAAGITAAKKYQAVKSGVLL
jgi:hypothetical protein